MRGSCYRDGADPVRADVGNFTGRGFGGVDLVGQRDRERSELFGAHLIEGVGDCGLVRLRDQRHEDGRLLRGELLA